LLASISADKIPTGLLLVSSWRQPAARERVKFPLALKALRSAIGVSASNRAQARSDADFDPIREDPDFVALVYPQAS